MQKQQTNKLCVLYPCCAWWRPAQYSQWSNNANLCVPYGPIPAQCSHTFHMDKCRNV